jgi:CHAT domain-containing protein
LYDSQGRYAEAEPLYKEALQLSEKVLGKEHPSTLSYVNNLALLYQSQGRYAEAEPLYKAALQLSEKVLGASHPNTLTSQSNYIILLVNMDNPRMAFRLLKQMETRLFSRSFQELYAASEGKMRRLFLKNISDFQDITFSFAQKYPEPEHIRYAADVVLRWKQVYAEEYAFQHRLLCVSTDPDVQKLRTRMAGLRSEFSAKIHHAEKGRELSGIIRDLNTAEEELRQKAMALKPTLSVSADDLDKITGKLPKHTALIEFRRFNPRDFKTGKAVSQNWAAYLLLSDIEAEQQVFFENLGSFEDMDKILKNSKDPSAGLYTMFISKFEKHLKGVKTLYIAPDGFLNIVSFASLKPSENTYLVQQYQINRVQTGRDLGNTLPRSSAAALVAFGGVDYGQFPGMAQNSPVSDETQKLLEEINPNLKAAKELEKGIPYLPHSLNESEMITRLFAINCKGGKAVFYKGKEATEKRLKELEAPPRILHLSTHGFYLQKAEDSPLAEIEPMVLSGLTLAGANLGLKGLMDENGDDGLLYSLEVLGLNLQGTELVSLSACETGQGVTDYSEGVYGLVRAFRTAGARSVLMTLSKVGDQPSRDFMVKFYETWLSAPEGTSPAEALHNTRIHFIKHTDPKYNDPSFWSPYVLVGGI